MSLSSRPPALRVPVTDVVSRTSLVTPVPPRAGGSDPPGVAVVQRPVRIISDPPPAPSGVNSAAASAFAAVGTGTTPRIEARGANGSPSEPSEPRITIESGTPPTGAGMLESDEDLDAGREAAEYRIDSDDPYESALADASARAAEEADADSAPPPAREAAEAEQDSYASMEVEQLELSEELSDDEDEEDAESDELDSEIEVSMPPPAPPPEALRAGSEAVHEAAAKHRPSGEFEELEVDAEERNDGAALRAAPPPPPVGRLSVPEPPDLAALARTARVQDLRPTRPRPHAWWEVFFDDDYLRTVRPPSREQIARQCDFIERRLGLRPGATLLDVGCGLGLHVLELASRGYLGVGLDLSLPMLSRASEEAQSRSLRVNFLHSDMREMSFDGAFDAVLCMGTTLGYFDEETNRRIVERLYRALKPGGVLLLDLVNRDHVIRSQPNLIWFEGDGCVCMEESEFNFFTSRLHVKRTVILDSGRQTENEYSLRLYSLHELGQLLNGIGFRVREVSGRDALPGVFFGQESPNLVIVAERRAPDSNE
jgi:SAM-dependent methyltransferase